jgi:hypothetical protein
VAAIGVNAAHFAAESFGAMFERLAKDHRIGGFELVPVPIYVGADNDDPDQLAHVAVFIIPWGDTGGHGVPRQ